MATFLKMYIHGHVNEMRSTLKLALLFFKCWISYLFFCPKSNGVMSKWIISTKRKFRFLTESFAWISGSWCRRVIQLKYSHILWRKGDIKFMFRVFRCINNLLLYSQLIFEFGFIFPCLASTGKIPVLCQISPQYNTFRYIY